jgi:hypothetical protein
MEEKGRANLLTPILYIIIAMIILWLVNYDRTKGVFSSGLLFVFWLLVSLAGIPDVIDYSITFSQQVSHFYKHVDTNNNHLYIDEIRVNVDRVYQCLASFYLCIYIIYQ